MAKNSFRSILKNYELKNVLRYLPMSLVINLGRGLTFFITKGKADALLGTLSAIIWTIYNLAGTISDRQIVQKKRVLSDSFLKRKIFIEKPLFEILRKTFL
mgnify:FL=1